MNEKYRKQILEKCQNGVQLSFHKSGIDWKLGKPLSFGVTKDGFPFAVWEHRDFGSITVGISRDGKEPQSRLRNDASSAIDLTTFEARMRTAERMSQVIVH